VKISAHLMVRDGADVVPRLVRSLRGVATELCAIDTGSQDCTMDLLPRLCAEHGITFRGKAISPISRPDLYFLDMPSSFKRSMSGSFRGRPILRDFATARNLGLEMCTGDVVLKVDVDDEVLTPDGVLAAAEVIAARPEVDVVMAPYEVADPSTKEVEYVAMYTRMWRNRPEIRFRGVCHENVDWWRRAPNWLMANNALRVRDHRDAGSRGVVDRHYYKVLLREHEQWVDFDRHVLLYLAEEGIRVDPVESLHYLGILVDLFTDLDLRWMATIRGECLHAIGDLRGAELELGRAAAMGSRRAALLRGMVLAQIGEPGWPEVLACALEVASTCCYPQGATRSEVLRARKLLEKKP